MTTPALIAKTGLLIVAATMMAVTATAAPAERIDYIFVDRGHTVRAARVVVTAATRTASDHYPLVVDIEAG